VVESRPPVRLHKYLADAGVDSRRRCEDYVRAGRVTVNDEVAAVGASVVPGRDRVRFDGRPVLPLARRTVIMLSKPPGYLCSCRQGREAGKLVTELVPVGVRLYPVGRLDRESEGLLLLTDDGELAQRLAHPRFGKEKEYVVELERDAEDAVCARLIAGVELDDGPARAVRATRRGGRTLSVVLTEGRKRQVRRMLAALGHRVVRLRRVRLAGLELGRLRPGEWRRLSDSEVNAQLLASSEG